jgi:hypothetical protein
MCQPVRDQSGAPADIQDLCGRTVGWLRYWYSKMQRLLYVKSVVWRYRYTVKTTADWIYTYTVIIQVASLLTKWIRSTVEVSTNATDPGSTSRYSRSMWRDSKCSGRSRCSVSFMWRKRIMEDTDILVKGTTADWIYTYTIGAWAASLHHKMEAVP